MLPPLMVQAVWRALNEAGVSDSAFANIAALDEERLKQLAQQINGLLSDNVRQRPVEVLTSHPGIGCANIHALRKAGFCTLGDLVNRVGWKYANPPELAQIPNWGTSTISYLSDYLTQEGLLSTR